MKVHELSFDPVIDLETEILILMIINRSVL